MPDLPELPDPAEGAESPAPAGPADAVAPGDSPGDAPVPETPPATDDELFAQLVANFDDPVQAEDRTWPEAEDVADLAPAPRPRPTIVRLPRVQALPPIDPRAWSPAEDPDEGHFVPPPPEPLPPAQAPTRLALAALVLGLVLIGLYLIGQLPGLGAVLGGGLFLGGTATLVSRMRVDDDEDDPDPHNGAVV